MLRFARSFSHSAVLSRHITVIGSGQMGVGIAYVAAANAKANVTLVDNSPASLEKGSGFIDKLLGKNVSKGKISEQDAKDVRGRIASSTDLDSTVAASDFVIEAVPEILGLKQQIFSQLAKCAAPHTILGTNTSSISITKIAAAAVGAEDRVIGVHFMNPVPVQKGVEIIRGLQTSDSSWKNATELVSAMGKIVSTSADCPGFLANRILMPYINEAILTLETGVGKAKDIDSIMKNGCAMPMGPLALADFIGLDTCLAIMQVLYRDTGDSKYRPSVLLQRYVDAGWLGNKSGRGFYSY